MRLAGDDTIIMIEGEAIRLRPSLRAAVRLERRFGGFRPLLQDLLDGSLRAFGAIIAECGDHADPHAFITQPGAEPIRDRLERITPAIVALVLDLADVGPSDPDAPKVEKPGPKVTLAEAYATLFGIATGVLGWAPSTAWAASVPEILAALDQHVALERAKAGIPDPKSAGPDDGYLDAAGLAELAGMGAAF